MVGMRVREQAILPKFLTWEDWRMSCGGQGNGG